MKDFELDPGVTDDGDASDGFERFVTDSEPQLRRALVAAYGPERGREATAEALGWAWEHWHQVQAMDRPIGYLYRVGQSRTRSRKVPPTSPATDSIDALPDPELFEALRQLTERQRIAVVLVHGFGYTLRDVADLLGIRTTSVQNHVERGLRRLRHHLEESP